MSEGSISTESPRARARDTFVRALAARLSAIYALLRRDLIFWIGVGVMLVPTLLQLATHAWDKEQSAHAPIVLATGVWLLARAYPEAARRAVAPRSTGVYVAFFLCLALYAAARVTGLLEVRALAVYLVGITVLYGLGGANVLRYLWFPIAYLAFLVPIPDTLIDNGTQPIKLGISAAVVDTLAAFSYPVAQSGVSIFVGQFELLIATACSGLNSLISLTAIGSFYVYLRHEASARYTFILILAIIPIAILANFVRVLILVLITFHSGEATAQGFLHETSGMFLFLFALVAIFGLDRLLSAVWRQQGA